MASQKKWPPSPGPGIEEAGLTGSRGFLINRLVYSPVCHFLAIAVLGLLIYSNTFHSPFQWDEAEFLVDNPVVKNLSYFADPSEAPWENAYALKNRYIGYLTFALNYKMNGFDVTGYHVVNLAIHLINAILVYFLVLLTFRTPYFKRMGDWQGANGQQPTDGKQESSHTGIAPTSSSRIFYYSLFTIHDSRLFALAAALLFVAHPVQTEAVTYVFQRFASLVAMFYLLSMIFYIKGRLAGLQADRLTSSQVRMPAGKQANKLASRQEAMGRGKKQDEQNSSASLSVPIAYRLSPIAYYSFSLVFAICAMKTKENAVTLPLVITLYEFLFFSGPLKSRLPRLLPFLLALLIIPLTVLQIEGSFGEIVKPMAEPSALGFQNLSRSEYFFTQFRVIVTYLRLLFLPVNQTLIYDYPVYSSFFKPPVLASAFFLATLFGIAVYLIYKSRMKVGGWRSEDRGLSLEPQTLNLYRLIAFGILWFFVTLSIESSIIPLAQVIDEYRIYLPSVGFFLAAISLGLIIIVKVRGVTLKSGAVFLLVTILILSSATYARNIVWEDKISLWEDVLSKNSTSPKVFNNLGIAYYEKGRYEDAIEMYKRSISLSPDNFFAYTNLGAAYATSGRMDMAIDSFAEAIALEPDNGVAYANMARAYRRRGLFDKAVEYYLKAVALNPDDSMAYYGLGSTYKTLGRLDDALDAYTRFVRLSPQNAEAYKSRGSVYARKGDRERAEQDFREACSRGCEECCNYLRGRGLQ